jgi:HD-GYP domain-containing protein (c-di-GMP phosphodiesterase class II)
MLRLTIQRAAPGMVVSMPVMHPQIPGHVLLKPGAELDDVAITRLRELGVRQLIIDYPPTAFLMRYASPGLALEQARLAQTVGAGIDALTRDLHAPFEFTAYLDGVRSLIQKLVDDPAAAIFLHDIVDPRSPIARHSFNVGFLSLLMGLRLDGYLIASRARISPRRAGNIESLGLGALLHDVGMLRLSPEVLSRWETDRNEDDPSYQKHVGLGFQFVRGKVAPTAAAAILHHHQRLDGSGFPKKQRGFGPPTALRGSEIHIFARIIGVADVFDRSRQPETPDGDPVPTVRALNRTLRLVRAGKLDPVVFKALLSVVPAFAPGSIVTLSDTRRCIVTAWEPSSPCRPTVCPISPEAERALRDGGERLRAACEISLGECIDLREHASLRVAHADGRDVSEDLFDPAFPGEFDLRLMYPGPLSEMFALVAPPPLPPATLLGPGLERPAGLDRPTRRIAG